MRRGDSPPHDFRHASRWVGESQDDAVGPQGAALILELQRLRQAFEQEEPDATHEAKARRPARENLRPAPRQRTAPAEAQGQDGTGARCLPGATRTFGRRSGGAENRTPPEPAAAPTRRRNKHVHEPAVTPVARRSEHGRKEAAAPAWRKSEPARELPIDPPPDRDRPILAPDDPSLINVMRPGLELPGAGDKRRSMHIESPRLTLSPPQAAQSPQQPSDS